MKKAILPLTLVFSFFLLSCEPEEIEFNSKAEVESDVRVYSDTGNQADADPTKKKG